MGETERGRGSHSGPFHLLTDTNAIQAREEGLPVDWAESELADLIWAINQVMRAKDSGSAGPSMFAPEDLKGNWVEAGGGIAYDDGDLLGQGSLQTYVFRGQFRATDRASNERPAAIKVPPVFMLLLRVCARTFALL